MIEGYSEVGNRLHNGPHIALLEQRAGWTPMSVLATPLAAGNKRVRTFKIMFINRRERYHWPPERFKGLIAGVIEFTCCV